MIWDCAQSVVGWLIIGSSLGVPFVFAGYVQVLAWCAGERREMAGSGSGGILFQVFDRRREDLTFQCVKLGPLGIPLALAYMLIATFAFAELAVSTW